jgi:hypothetical protein
MQIVKSIFYDLIRLNISVGHISAREDIRVAHITDALFIRNQPWITEKNGLCTSVRTYDTMRNPLGGF